MVERGVIRNREQASQIKDYSGLKFGKITPTDIDGMIEYHDKGMIFLEIKYKDADMPYGQKLALERLCDFLNQAGKPTIVIVASHESDEDIDVANTIVKKYRWNYEWKDCPGNRTTRSLIESFIKHIDKIL
jgi:hypothetical protein